MILGLPLSGAGLAQDNPPSPAAPPAARGDGGVAAETAIGTEAATLEPVPADLSRPRAFGPRQKALTIASWYLGGAGDSESAQAAGDQTSVTWRHTFGSERRTAHWRTIKAAGFAADVIAMQGARQASDARRQFQARSHHVVVSRQLLARAGRRATGIAVFRSDAPATTALAYRRQRGVRLAGFQHILPSQGQAAHGAGSEPAAITAFRLNIYGKMVWFASLDLAAQCADAASRDQCPEAALAAAFLAWARDVDGQRWPLVLLGQRPAAVDDGLAKNGFKLQQLNFTKKAGCDREPGGVLLAHAARMALPSARLEAVAQPGDGNACAHLARLTLVLRSEAAAHARPAGER